MTGADNGLELFESVGPDQIGAINLVLSCLADGPREAEPTLRALLMHSGVSGRLVNARGCLGIAMQLGLLHEIDGQLALSALGHELLAAASWPPYNLLTEAQGRRLLSMSWCSSQSLLRPFPASCARCGGGQTDLWS